MKNEKWEQNRERDFETLGNNNTMLFFMIGVFESSVTLKLSHDKWIDFFSSLTKIWIEFQTNK